MYLKKKSNYEATMMETNKTKLLRFTRHDCYLNFNIFVLSINAFSVGHVLLYTLIEPHIYIYINMCGLTPRA